jgi:DNA-binding response OmpR family regulator
MRILVATAELPFSSWVASAAGRAACECETAMTWAALVQKLAAGSFDLVILDLTLAALEVHAAVAAVRSHATQTAVVAVAPHVREDLLGAAEEAGCDDVFVRGRFHAQLDAILARYRESS